MDAMQQEYDGLRRLHESTNEALRNAEAENAALRAQVALLEAKERQWEVDRVRQQAVIHGALERANAASNGYLEEVARLRAELHALRAQER
jgi:phage I-like protein